MKQPIDRVMIAASDLSAANARRALRAFGDQPGDASTTFPVLLRAGV